MGKKHLSSTPLIPVDMHFWTSLAYHRYSGIQRNNRQRNPRGKLSRAAKSITSWCQAVPTAVTGDKKQMKQGRKLEEWKWEVQAEVGWAFWSIVPDSSLTCKSFGDSWRLSVSPDKSHRRYTYLATNVEHGCQLETGSIIGPHNVLDKAEGRERQSYFRLLGLLLSDKNKKGSMA